MTKAVHQISRNGQGCSIHNLSGILQNRVARYIWRRVEAPRGEGVTSAGGGQRFEAEGRQNFRASRVPGVGNYECAGPFMEGPKGVEFCLTRRSHVFRLQDLDCGTAPLVVWIAGAAWNRGATTY